MRRTTVIVAMLLAGIGLACDAEEPSTDRPDGFHTVGEVDYIDTETSTIVVDDVQMRLAPDTLVRGPNDEQMAVAETMPGMMVGISVDAPAGGTSDLVSEIRVLSEGTSP